MWLRPVQTGLAGYPRCGPFLRHVCLAGTTDPCVGCRPVNRRYPSIDGSRMSRRHAPAIYDWQATCRRCVDTRDGLPPWFRAEQSRQLVTISRRPCKNQRSYNTVRRCEDRSHGTASTVVTQNETASDDQEYVGAYMVAIGLSTFRVCRTSAQMAALIDLRMPGFGTGMGALLGCLGVGGLGVSTDIHDATPHLLRS